MLIGAMPSIYHALSVSVLNGLTIDLVLLNFQFRAWCTQVLDSGLTLPSALHFSSVLAWLS
jgi:hypothetical protein